MKQNQIHYKKRLSFYKTHKNMNKVICNAYLHKIVLLPQTVISKAIHSQLQ